MTINLTFSDAGDSVQLTIDPPIHTLASEDSPVADAALIALDALALHYSVDMSAEDRAALHRENTR